jgi:DNA-binding XRE family transcriptional regulator
VDKIKQPGDQIRKLREQAHLSQAVFARYLNLTVGYVSQLERGAKRRAVRHSCSSTSSAARVSRRFCDRAPVICILADLIGCIVKPAGDVDE